MKKHEFTILAIGLIFGFMFASGLVGIASYFSEPTVEDDYGLAEAYAEGRSDGRLKEIERSNELLTFSYELGYHTCKEYYNLNSAPLQEEPEAFPTLKEGVFPNCYFRLGADYNGQTRECITPLQEEGDARFIFHRSKEVDLEVDREILCFDNNGMVVPKSECERLIIEAEPVSIGEEVYPICDTTCFGQSCKCYEPDLICVKSSYDCNEGFELVKVVNQVKHCLKVEYGIEYWQTKSRFPLWCTCWSDESCAKELAPLSSEQEAKKT